MKKRKLVPFAVLTVLVWTAPSAAQSNRERLINEARNEFSDSVALGLYLSALDPALGEPDSLWAVAGFDLADRLILLEQRRQASIWLRWVARHSPQLPIDRDWYLPAVVEEYDLALEAVKGSSDTLPATTTWLWPEEYDGALVGSVEATASGQRIPIASVAEGRENDQPAESLSLLPGTHTLVVVADGYEPAQFVREVLPGVTTVLDVDLVPLLSPEVLSGAAESVVRITYSSAGQEVCGNGLISGADGLVLTTLSSLRDGTLFSVDAFSGQEAFVDVPVVATDPEKDLAVLQISTGRAASLPSASTVSGEQYAWSVHFLACAGLTSARTRVGAWLGPSLSAGRVAYPLPAEAVGSPLIDRGGSLLGLVTGPSNFLPVALTEGILGQARQDRLDRARQDLTGPGDQLASSQIGPGGGFPWKWVGAGLGAAGLAFALTQGGGGDGGETGSPPPTTGGIVITFPSGG